MTSEQTVGLAATRYEVCANGARGRQDYQWWIPRVCIAIERIDPADAPQEPVRRVLSYPEPVSHTRDDAPRNGRAAELLAALAEYRPARRRLLNLLGLAVSNRDPVPELAEHLVADLLGGDVAPSRVQAGWDVTTLEGTVQVRTLSNAGSDRWVNEHLVRSVAGVDRYALVVLEDLTVSAVLVFPADLTGVGALLGKRHADQATTLQLTRRDYVRLLADRAEAGAAGVQVWTPAELGSTAPS